MTHVIGFPLTTDQHGIIWTALREKVPSNMRNMFRFKSFYACIKSHADLCSPFIHYVVSNDSVSGQ